MSSLETYERRLLPHYHAATRNNPTDFAASHDWNSETLLVVVAASERNSLQDGPQIDEFMKFQKSGKKTFEETNHSARVMRLIVRYVEITSRPPPSSAARIVCSWCQQRRSWR